MKKRDFKRVVWIGDLHCGHRAGLTPPAWQLRPNREAEPDRMKWVRLQEECWAWYSLEIRSLGPIDLLIVGGDAIDGDGARSGGTELICTDRNKQVDMAEKCILEAKARRVEFVYGTPYHTGQIEDAEDNLAARFPRSSIGSHQWYDVNGVIFDCKHHAQAKGLPHTRASTASEDDLWNSVWSENDEQPRGDIILRGHVHYFNANLSIHKGRLHWVIAAPALQGMGSKYGARRCRGRVHFGFLYFDVPNNGSVPLCQIKYAKLASQKATASKL